MSGGGASFVEIGAAIAHAVKRPRNGRDRDRRARRRIVQALSEKNHPYDSRRFECTLGTPPRARTSYGPGATSAWCSQQKHYREVLLHVALVRNKAANERQPGFPGCCFTLVMLLTRGRISLSCGQHSAIPGHGHLWALRATGPVPVPAPLLRKKGTYTRTHSPPGYPRHRLRGTDARIKSSWRQAQGGVQTCPDRRPMMPQRFGPWPFLPPCTR